MVGGQNLGENGRGSSKVVGGVYERGRGSKLSKNGKGAKSAPPELFVQNL